MSFIFKLFFYATNCLKCWYQEATCKLFTKITRNVKCRHICVFYIGILFIHTYVPILNIRVH